MATPSKSGLESQLPGAYVDPLYSPATALHFPPIAFDLMLEFSDIPNFMHKCTEWLSVSKKHMAGKLTKYII